jgi:hypothetical protein
MKTEMLLKMMVVTQVVTAIAIVLLLILYLNHINRKNKKPFIDLKKYGRHRRYNNN